MHGDRLEFLRARFDAGLAWVHFPVGLGGLDAPRELQAVVDAAVRRSRRAGQQPAPDRHRPGDGGADDPRRTARPSSASGGCARCGRARRSGASCSASPAPAATSPRWPPAPCATATTGSCPARRSGRRWRTWRSWAIIVTRTDPDVPKHAGLTYFVLDMHAAGRRGAAAAPDHRRGRVQRGVPRRRPHPGRPAPRRRRRRLAGRADHADERAGGDRRRRDPARDRRDHRRLRRVARRARRSARGPRTTS